MTGGDPAEVAARHSKSHGQIIPNGSTCSRQFSKTSRWAPSYGWFRTAVAQTRFDWESTRKRYDRDGDRRIARGEFPGSDAEFARLDRDRDQLLTAADFDFSASALPRRLARWCFLGSIATATARSRARSSMRSSRRATAAARASCRSPICRRRSAARRPQARRPASGRPSKATLVRGLFRQEIGSLQPGPKLDESAPDFTLKTNDGKAEVTLSKLIGPKPVVLVFGNFTCGPFRSQSGNIEKLYRRYKDRATFVMVYVREAHPTDGWRMESNDRVGVIDRPAQDLRRTGRASRRSAAGLLGLGFPMLVDTIDDAVGARYSGMPGRLYLIDREGKVAFKSGRGPYLLQAGRAGAIADLAASGRGGQGARSERSSLR